MSAVAPRAGRSISAAVPYVKTALDRIEISYRQPPEDMAVERHSVQIRNGRVPEEDLSLESQGFILARWPSRLVRERRRELIEENTRPSEVVGPVNLAYLAEMEPLVMQLSGAREVFAQYGTVTVRFSKRAAERGWMAASAFAHLDFERSEIDRLLRETLEITGRQIAPFRRQVLLQTWRVLTEPPQDMPLAICDGRSVSSSEMIRMDFIGPPGSRNERVRSRACRFDPRHAWYYFPDMTPEEVLVFKGFDSACPDAMNAMHTTFDDTSVASPVPRGSIECRFIALYD